MVDIWEDRPVLGPGSDFHDDPVEGGAPVVSADGHWWWDGHHWRPAVEVVEPFGAIAAPC